MLIYADCNIPSWPSADRTRLVLVRLHAEHEVFFVWGQVPFAKCNVHLDARAVGTLEDELGILGSTLQDAVGFQSHIQA